MLRHSYFIRQICKIWQVQDYLEVGVREGYNFHIIKKVVPNCYGVEIDRQWEKRLKDFNIFWCSSDEFFEKHRDEIPQPKVIFLDAGHTFEQVKRDLENALEILQHDGMIFIHDTDPVSKSIAEVFKITEAWKIIDYVHDYRQDLDILTIPNWGEGLSLIRRRSARRVLEWLN